jgi:hypothetical protein
MLHYLLSFCLLFTSVQFVYSQGYTEEEFVGPKVTHGIRLTVSTPQAWKKLNPPLNLALTFDRKKSFFLVGLDFWLPENRATDTTKSRLVGMGLQFSYGRYLSRKDQKGFYLIYNFRYQDTFEYWQGREWIQGPKGGYSAPLRTRRLDYETYESIFGFGIKVPLSNRFCFDLMTGAGAAIYIDYAKNIDVSFHPSLQARGGIGYFFK